MSDLNPSHNTPFDQQLQEDVESRRAAPTAGTIRIGESANALPQTNSSTNQQPAISPTTNADSHDTTHGSDVTHVVARVRPPLPVLIGLAMAVGAVCVAGGALMVRRLVPDTRPTFTSNNQQRPGGDTLMNPDLVIQNPGAESTEEVSPQETPAIEIEELPPVVDQKQAAETQQAPLTTPRADEVQSQPENKRNDDKPGEGRVEDKPDSDTSAFSGPSYELTPPSGFSLQQKGRRTIWKHENGAQILVETGKAGKGSLTDGWLRLERDLQKRYGRGYKSLGIREGQFAGKPAAIWEFELTGKDGVTRRKIDIGIQHEGRGYAVLGSAPKETFDKVSPQIRAAIDSFKLKPGGGSPKPENAQDMPEPTRREIKRRSRTTEATPPTREKPQEALPTLQPTPERGY